MGALSKLDELLLNRQVRTCSLAVPGTTRNNNSENLEPLGIVPLAIHVPKWCSLASGSLNGSEQKETHHMVSRVQQDTPYCSHGASPGKQKKERSTIQPEFRTEITPETIEANQILLALHELAMNSTSANFNNNINRIAKLLKSLTTTMRIFYGKSNKI